ncbi:MAG TPA: Ig-like domain-containing protein [Terriglobales bacterium]|nr:Ig-like domain-containing protein [Terriglobales bacterium]
MTAITPNRAVQGQTLGVSLQGTNFASGASVNVAGGQITVTGATVLSSTAMTASFALAANATPGAVTVTVTSAGVTTNSVLFTVASALQVTATLPTNGAAGVAVNQQISATFSDALQCSTVSTASFQVAAPGGAPVAGTVSCAGSTATFAPTQRLSSGASYTATLTTAITDAAGDPMTGAFTWSFATAAAPTVIATLPAPGTTGVPITQPSIAATFSEPMNCATLTTASFVVAAAGVPIAGTVNCSGATASFAPAAALTVNTLYTASLATSVANPAGAGLASPFIWTLKTGPAPAVPPTVIATVPAPGATGVPLNQKLAATFSEGMNPATITAATFTLSGPGGAAVAGTVTYVATGSVATFAPTAPLAALTTYLATITTGVTSVAGDPMAANFTWTFVTGAAPDTTKPTLVATLPANLATAVAINAAVTATFSEAMDPATLTAATFTLTGPGSTSIAGLVTYAAIADTATFKPNVNLLPGTQYTATVTTGAQDLAGNPLGAGLVSNPWTFTTAPGPSTTKPTIVLTNPAAGATNVAINASVNATFSEAMDPLTLTATTFQLTGPGGAAIAATVSYDPVNFIATLTPLANLAANTTYNANVTTGAADLAGNTLGTGVVSNPWSFTTAAVVAPAVNLGAAAPFGGFGGGAGMTNQGILTIINGDIGTTGASTVMTGFHDPGPGCTYTETPLNIGAVNGLIYTAAPPPTVACPTEGTAATMAVATQAATDALAAFNATSPALMPPTVAAQAAELGGLTLPPGVYQSASGSFSITNGDLTLDGQGNANAVFVFQSATSLTVGIAGPTGARNVILINGAQAKNVYWHVGSAATINGAGGGTMVGTILSQSGISFSTAGNVALTVLNGRAITLTGPVTMVDTVITVPLP